MLLFQAGYAEIKEESRYENDTLTARFQINESGIMDGFYEAYYPNRTIKLKGVYSQGIRTGTWISFDERGSVVAIEIFDHQGTRIGPDKPADVPSPSAQYEGRRSPKQGLAIFTNSPDVEIIINNKSYGMNDKALIELETGEYLIEAKRRGCVTVFTRKTVELNTVSPVTLTPKKVQFQVSPPLFISLMGKRRFQPGMIPFLGSIRYGKNITSIYYAFGSADNGPPYDQDYADGIYYNYVYYYNKMYRFFGLHHTHLLIDKNYLLFSVGASSSYSRFTAIKNSSYYDSQTSQHINSESDYRDAFFALGPRICLQTGVKSIKFVSAFNYLIRIDRHASVFHRRNMITMEHGMLFEF